MPAAKTDYVILGMLSIHPMSGYDIQKAIKESVAYFWSESYGQIYPALKHLAAQRLIKARTASSGRRERQVYALTARGKAHLGAWLAMAPEARPPRIELLLKLFFGVAAAEACAGHVREFRTQQAHFLGEALALEKLFAGAPKRPSDPGLAFRFRTLRYGLLHLQADLAWADETLAFLAKPSHR
jgi:DNA-binding PadR family transcriptional regulator